MGTSLIDPAARGKKGKFLTNAQMMFCEHLAADPLFSAANAAKKAGFKHPTQSGTRLLNNIKVREYLGKVLDERIQRCRLESDSVLKHLNNALFLDPMDIFEKGPNGEFRVKPLDEIPKHVRVCISKLECKVIEYDDGTTESHIKIETMSKDAAMTAAMKHLGLMEPDGKVSVSMNGRMIDFDELCDPPGNGEVIDGKVANTIEEV